MHSSEPVQVVPAGGPALLLQLGRLIVRAKSRSRSPPRHERLLQAKLRAAAGEPSTSKQYLDHQPKPDPEEPKTDVQLDDHVQALWRDQIPLCIEVILVPDCGCKMSKVDGLVAVDSERCMLLERWTMSVFLRKTNESPAFITSQWLLNAVRSQLHFSQLSAWLSRLKTTMPAMPEDPDPNERRRKLSRETCNIKKLEANCDEKDLPRTTKEEVKSQRKLNIVYSVKIPGENYKFLEFIRPPTDHTFPITDIGSNVYLKVVFQSLPRIDDVPVLKCMCGHGKQTPKRRASKEMPSNLHEELTLRMNDLTLGSHDAKNEDKYRGKGALFSPDLGVINSNIGISSGVTRRLSIFSNPGSSEYLYSRASTPERQEESGEVKDNPKDNRSHVDRPYECAKDIVANYLLLDDRMHTPCSESGKHRCNCDDESDNGKENQKSSTSVRAEPKKQLDERRLKEIAKYKRRLRKESKLRKLRESGTSEGASESGGEAKKKEEPHTSIPILQASRFDRLRAIGCYRNQTYLTLPASRIEIKSPFASSDLNDPPPTEYPKSISVATQTDDPTCSCGHRMQLKCDKCSSKGMMRSEGHYDLASLDRSEMLLDAIRRCGGSPGPRDDGSDKLEERVKKHKCDIPSNILKCDIMFRDSLNNDSFTSVSDSAPVMAGVRKCPEDDDGQDGRGAIIKRPKLKTFLPIARGRIDKIVSDRFSQKEPTTSSSDDIEQLLLKDDDSVFAYMSRRNEESKLINKNKSDDYVLYEKSDYGTFDKSGSESPREPSDFKFSEPDLKFSDPWHGFSDPERGFSDPERGFSDPEHRFSDPERGFSDPEHRKAFDNQVPSPSEMDRFRWRFDSAASMIFHTKTGLPLTSSPAPLKRGNNCFDYDDSITNISGIKSALFHPAPTTESCVSPNSRRASTPPPRACTPVPRRAPPAPVVRAPRHQPSAALLGSFEESALKGRLEPVATVHGFTAELGASGAFCPPHRKLPVTVFFYAPGGTNAPYMGHINLGPGGYRVSRSGTVQVSLLNPHGTLVKMFVVLYDLTAMPAGARTFLRQRTYYMPAGRSAPPPPAACHKWLRYLIHLRFLTSKSGKLYLHTDIRIIVSRKADLDTATAHSAIFKTITDATNRTRDENNSTNQEREPKLTTNQERERTKLSTNQDRVPANREREPKLATNQERASASRPVNRVFGGCGDYGETCCPDFELGLDTQNGVSYELRSFTYAPENPKFSPR